MIHTYLAFGPLTSNYQNAPQLHYVHLWLPTLFCWFPFYLQKIYVLITALKIFWIRNSSSIEIFSCHKWKNTQVNFSRGCARMYFFYKNIRKTKRFSRFFLPILPKITYLFVCDKPYCWPLHLTQVLMFKGRDSSKSKQGVGNEIFWYESEIIRDLCRPLITSEA